MSLKLDELRKRLLQQPLDAGFGMPSGEAEAEPASSAPEAVEKSSLKPDLKAVETSRPNESLIVKTVELGQLRERPAAPKETNVTPLNGRANLSSVPRSDAAFNENQVIESVGKLFEQTKTFQVRFDELVKGAEQIEQMTDSAARLFGPLRAFHTQLAQLATSFESMRAFQRQLAELSKTFEPMRIVHDQLAQLSQSIQSNLAQVVKALDPARDFRDRIISMAASLDQASELQADFAELYSTFRPSSEPAADGVNARGRDDASQSAAH